MKIRSQLASFELTDLGQRWKAMASGELVYLSQSDYILFLGDRCLSSRPGVLQSQAGVTGAAERVLEWGAERERVSSRKLRGSGGMLARKICEIRVPNWLEMH